MIKTDRIVYGQYHITVYLESNEKFNLFYGNELIKTLSSKSEISHNQYSSLITEDKKFRCRHKAIRYISIRNRSKFEIVNYLKKKEFDEDIIQETINYLNSKKLLNDYEFAIQFVESRLRGKPRGKNLILKDLYKRGIDKNLADKAIVECEADLVDLDIVYEFALKKYNKVKEKQNSIPKVAFYLTQRGFDSNTIFKIINRLKKNS